MAAARGADLTPLFVWGRLLASLPVLSPPLIPFPSQLSLSLSPRGGRSRVWFRERPLGRVTKRFPLRERESESERAEWRELGSLPREAAQLWTSPTPARPGPLS